MRQRGVECRLVRHRHEEDGAGHTHDGSHDHHHAESTHRGGAHSHAHAHGGGALRVLEGSPEAHRTPLSRGAGQGKLLHFDAFSGVAGDMCVAALVDLGVPFDSVQQAIAELQLPGVRLELQSVMSGAVGAAKFDVHVSSKQPQRSYRQIKALLEGATLHEGAKGLALGIFARLARAEAAVHRVPLDDVHFHEVGAVDSLVDIVGAAVCLDYLGAAVTCSPLPLGRGMIRCQHGLIPVPAPATVLCLEGLDTVASELEAELVTPTGAAIVGQVARSVRWPDLRPERVGWGSGTRTFVDRPNALRVVLGEPTPAAAATTPQGTHVLVEANVDDASGELLGLAIDALLGAGALDAWATPNVMKKGRPGWTLCALGEQPLEQALAEVVLRETSSIGVRVSSVRRVELPRTIVEVDTAYGRVPVKVSGHPGSPMAHHKPEFDVCQALAKQHGVPARMVLEAALIALAKTRSSSL